MSDLHSEFTQAAQDVTRLPAEPDNDVKLTLYALFKQATEGDVSGKRPGFTNPVGRAKYDAWAKVSGMAPDTAKQEYVQLVRALGG